MDDRGSELKHTAPKTRDFTSIPNFSGYFLSKFVVSKRIFRDTDDYRKINKNKHK